LGEKWSPRGRVDESRGASRRRVSVLFRIAIVLLAVALLAGAVVVVAGARATIVVGIQNSHATGPTDYQVLVDGGVRAVGVLGPADHAWLEVNLYPGPGVHAYRISVYSERTAVGDVRCVTLCGGQTLVLEMTA